VTADQSSICESPDQWLLYSDGSVYVVCLSLQAKEQISMARKVGQIIARGDRRWLIRVYLGRDQESRKRKYHNRTIHGPLREAQLYLTRKLRERDLGRDLEGAKINLNEYLDRWLQTAVKPRVREKTCQDNEGMRRRYIRPTLGERVLAAMRPLDLQTTYQLMIERGLSARTVHHTYVVLRSALRQALRWHLLLENPADGVKPPQQARREMRVLTVEQARAFLKAAQATPHGPVLAVALTTGMRPSEYLTLRWQDIDWARHTVSVVRSIRRLNGRWCYADTKRSRSRRLVKLQNWIVAVLRELGSITTGNGLCPEASDLVFKTVTGHPINSDSLAKHFKSILELAGLPRVRLYDLRHTAATLAAGVPPKVVSEQLGHASAAFTLDIYAHVLPHMQDEAAARMETMLFGHQNFVAS
jgi:integrase